MPSDALTILQASTTKTASFNGAAVTLPGGTPRRGLKARIIYSAASAASGTDTVTFSVDVSYDGGSTWLADFVAPPITLDTTSAAPKSGEIFIPFEVTATGSSAPQIRLSAAFSATTHTDTITYQGDISLSRP